MTSRHSILAMGVSFAMALLIGTLQVARLKASRARAEAAVAAVHQVERDVARLISIRGARHTVATGLEPQSDALALLGAAMERASLPSSRIRSLAPIEQGGLRSSPTESDYQQRSLRLVLAGLSMPDLGAFLGKWRDTQAIWTVREISLRSESSRPDIEPRWTATMTLTAAYWPGSSAERGRP